MDQLQPQIRLLYQMSTLTCHSNCQPNLDSFALKVIVLNGWVPITQYNHQKKNSPFLKVFDLTEIIKLNDSKLETPFLLQ